MWFHPYFGVQPKAITFPTDSKLLHAAIKGLNRMANKHGVRLRQSYLRIPATPVVETTPAGTASPKTWVSRSISPKLAPP